MASEECGTRKYHLPNARQPDGKICVLLLKKHACIAGESGRQLAERAHSGTDAGSSSPAGVFLYRHLSPEKAPEMGDSDLYERALTISGCLGVLSS